MGANHNIIKMTDFLSPFDEQRKAEEGGGREWG